MTNTPSTTRLDSVMGWQDIVLAPHHKSLSDALNLGEAIVFVGTMRRPQGGE